MKILCTMPSWLKHVIRQLFRPIIAQLAKNLPTMLETPVPESGRSNGDGIGYPLQYFGASLVAQLVKNLPAVQESWVWSLGWEDPWRRERLPTSVFWPREFYGLCSPWGHKELGPTEWLLLFKICFHRMLNTKNEQYCKLWILSDYGMSL